MEVSEINKNVRLGRFSAGSDRFLVVLLVVLLSVSVSFSGNVSAELLQDVVDEDGYGNSMGVYGVLTGDYPRGDVNGDGVVNVTDAVLLLRSLVGLQTLTSDQRGRADVNGDGRINVSDAVLILRIVVGLEDGSRPGPAPDPTPTPAPDPTPTPTPTPPPDSSAGLNKEYSIRGISIGDTASHVRSMLGSPNLQLASKYGFTWHIYNSNYRDYIQVGIQNNRVVGLYSASESWQSTGQVKVGVSDSYVRQVHGEPISHILKGNTNYQVELIDQVLVYLIDNDYYCTLFIDKHENNRVTAVMLIDKDAEHSIGYQGTPSNNLRDSFERQIFELANAIRARYGKRAYQWSDTARNAARSHSVDMGNRNFFHHNCPSGSTPGSRLTAAGVNWSSASENIAAGQSNAILAHQGWMNSLGHRDSIMGDNTRLGGGVAFSSNADWPVYYTQKFYIPR